MLSFIYRLLTRARKRDEVTQDMIGTFEEARADAHSRGRSAYFLFAIRELAGLLGSPGRLIPKTRWTLVVGCALAGLALGVAASYLLPASYTSEAVLQLGPPTIPGGLLANLDAIDLDTSGFEGHGLDLIRQLVTSRATLAEITHRCDLYPHGRETEPLEDILQGMRKEIRIERTGDFSIRVAFTYRDYPRGPLGHHKAQQVTQELASRLMGESTRVKSNRLFQAADYLKDRSEQAAKTWVQLNIQSRGLTPTDPSFDRVALDRELARKEYESLRQKLGEAEGVRALYNHGEGRNLQILDAASLPESPDISTTEMALYGLGSGLIVGLIATLWLALRGASSALLTPETAPSH